MPDNKNVETLNKESLIKAMIEVDSIKFGLVTTMVCVSEIKAGVTISVIMLLSNLLFKMLGFEHLSLFLLGSSYLVFMCVCLPAIIRLNVYKKCIKDAKESFTKFKG